MYSTSSSSSARPYRPEAFYQYCEEFTLNQHNAVMSQKISAQGQQEEMVANEAKSCENSSSIQGRPVRALCDA